MSDATPLAVVDGEDYDTRPASLHIPREAMRVFLEKFTGPLDLLLHLVRQHRIDVRDIPVAELTRQYISYVEEVVALRLELAADYLAMSAVLIEIKSRMLLPRAEEPEEEEDPRAELVRRLADYERIKNAARRLGEMPRAGRDFLVARIAPVAATRPKPRLSAPELAFALSAAAERARAPGELVIGRERMSLREAMALVMRDLSARGRSEFLELFETGAAAADQAGVVLMAVLELANERLVRIRQGRWDGPIVIRPGRRARDGG